MAVRVIRTNDEEIVIKEDYRAVEEYNRIIIYDTDSSQVARFLSEDVKEWRVESDEQGAAVGA